MAAKRYSTTYAGDICTITHEPRVEEVVYSEVRARLQIEHRSLVGDDYLRDDEQGKGEVAADNYEIGIPAHIPVAIAARIRGL